MRRVRSLAAVLAVLAIAVPAPASTADAFVNGDATAAGAMLPLAVSPNFDLWPVYSSSSVDNAKAHDLSGGFYPGFLLDAFAFSYGFQDEARAMLGLAEAQHPGEPRSARASTGDVAGKCRFGARFAIPRFMLDGCKQFFDSTLGAVPTRSGSGNATAGPAAAAGSAEGHAVSLADGVTVGSITARTGSRATSTSTVSDASVVLHDVRIGPSLRIAAITASATARAERAEAGARASLVLGAVTFDGRDAVITDRGVFAAPLDADATPAAHALEDVTSLLRHDGFDVRLLSRSERERPGSAYADAGGLIVSVRGEPPAQVVGEARDACAPVGGSTPAPLTTLDVDLGENPFYGEDVPFNQTPQRARIEVAVPPPAPCVAALVERALQTGIILAPSRASARWDALTPSPSRRDVVVRADDDGVVGSPPLGVLDPPARTPETGDAAPFAPQPDAPRVPIASVDAPIARRIELLYIALLSVGALVFAGRSSFRRATRL